jgi:hypothetical protein
LIAQLRRWADPIARIVFIYFVFACFVIGIGIALIWFFDDQPHEGYDIGAGAFCASIPIAIIFAGIVLFVLNRRALREEREEALKSTSEEKSQEA